MTFVHLLFSVRSLDLFCHFTHVFEGHFVLFYTMWGGILSGIELLDCVMAKFYRS